MKVAILGCKTSFDIILLSQLSELYQNLDIECYNNNGSISFGSKVLEIKNIRKINVENFDIIINLSNEFNEILDLVKEKNVFYLNLKEGSLLSGKNYSSKLLKIPHFSFNPIISFLNIVKKKLVGLNIVTGHAIAEFGKDAMNRFHKEIKDSYLKIIKQDEKGNDALAFNISFNMLNENLSEFENSIQENELLSQLKQSISIPLSVTSILNPVNKAGYSILNFELNNEINLEYLKKLIEKVGITYSYHALSAVYVENDDQIYAIRLRKEYKRYSVILVYDAVYRRITDIIDFISYQINKTNN